MTTETAPLGSSQPLTQANMDAMNVEVARLAGIIIRSLGALEPPRPPGDKQNPEPHRPGPSWDDLPSEVSALESRALAAEAERDRLRADRAALLNVKSTDGLTSSEWLMRTAAAEARCAELERALKALFSAASGARGPFYQLSRRENAAEALDAALNRARSALASRVQGSAPELAPVERTEACTCVRGPSSVVPSPACPQHGYRRQQCTAEMSGRVGWRCAYDAEPGSTLCWHHGARSAPSSDPAKEE